MKNYIRFLFWLGTLALTETWRQRESEDGVAGAVDGQDGPGGSGLLGMGDAEHEGARTGCPSEPAEPAPLLQPERGRFEQNAYDGHDYIALDTETYTWTAAVPEAVNTKRKWEAKKSIMEGEKVYLEEECVQWVHKYLENGKEDLKRTDPPSARVTPHTAPDGEVTLRCRVQDFYPAEISLTWLRDGEEQLQNMEFIETRPAGDGTFQKWAALGITSGQEGKYTCRVQHEGPPEPLTVKWEPQSSSTWIIVGSIAVVLSAVIAGVVICQNRNSGRKGGDYVQAADSDSAQGLSCSQSIGFYDHHCTLLANDPFPVLPI
ncbi:BOLA class I histocompatibility antigen, alpha chain BL3-6-like isoform X2 [Vombatus ursinus]|uniref:BOLA class I histocompatibility antigen, alpha chain BL3-6-like isoform X2 n=1 Tax=Vombatus ursinus TaxID=29139 RepID=UPI000FFD73F6|nr:BOLA class I histocompatibility antigen, alpha chain BL3-6-like isoform X2 [Vombatus ursinus]